MKILLITLGLVVTVSAAVFLYLQYGAWEESTVFDPKMDPVQEGHFISHPDTAVPDVKELETISY